ncbi:transposase [Myroides profundi]|uniref:REP element-mobilizing transposase RayT n=1 Tax=Myroides profundi TaxID=480520 RepID=A0AAJ4W132_MYRPR|nr:transposase [Myroides profundi]AJH13254.1 hypothetical protein MPR_0035 [Myroides profundi]SEQ06914.1 REP element-mobilizing transposase RayT [Myroides profundi]
MNKKFKGVYNRSSNRAKWWDYTNDGTYFITICTRDMKHNFGYIFQDKMYLNDLGRCVLNCWFSIPHYYPFVVLDAFIVMPNHVHGILHINRGNDKTKNVDNIMEFKNVSGSLGSIIKGFKVGVKKDANSLGIAFFWQDGYHDHIIRTVSAYQNIANYIHTNPSRWNKDRFYNEF